MPRIKEDTLFQPLLDSGGNWKPSLWLPLHATSVTVLINGKVFPIWIPHWQTSTYTSMQRYSIKMTESFNESLICPPTFRYAPNSCLLRAFHTSRNLENRVTYQ